MAVPDFATPTVESSGYKPPEPKYITTLRVPTIYEEVLLLLKPRLPETSENIASVEVWKFYADLLESYVPGLLESIREWNASDAHALYAGEKAVADLHHAIEAWRAVLTDERWRYKSIVAGYDEVLQAFAQAHSEAFHDEAGGFEEDWKAWKRGA
jgi:hypothetical protein